ncbi:MAG: hypothetical protein IPJ77_03735 [Planctomycetes bacterium]|nr:hypothetical protein [Planctomycetota bacterium]
MRARGDRGVLSRAREGHWSFRYPNGELREEGSYSAGRRTGSWTQYAPNGQLRSRGERRWNAQTASSEREGEWTFWHANGVVAEHGLYTAGLRAGHWEFTNEDGSVDAARTGEYHQGVKLDG